MNSNSMLKGSIQTIILKLLEDSEKMYGYEISQKVKEVTNGEIILKEGALYPALHKLESDGLLETYTEVFENRVRKYYSLTKEGKKEVALKLSDAKEFIDNLQLLLNLKSSTL
nr:helix-turn-helix transcriptional regulator [Pseudopedobacter sp.]